MSVAVPIYTYTRRRPGTPPRKRFFRHRPSTPKIVILRHRPPLNGIILHSCHPGSGRHKACSKCTPCRQPSLQARPRFWLRTATLVSGFALQWPIMAGLLLLFIRGFSSAPIWVILHCRPPCLKQSLQHESTHPAPTPAFLDSI